MTQEARVGGLGEALGQAVARVKARPTDVAGKLDLADLLIVTGDLERADSHLDLAGTMDPGFAVKAALVRQLIRAETHRRDVIFAGRAPDLVLETDGTIAAHLQRLLDWREGRPGSVVDTEAGAVAGRVDGAPFVGVRDLDDRFAGVLEVLTSTGKYFWIPWGAIQSLTLAPPQRWRDIVWRQAELDVSDGPSGVVYIPAIYPCAPGEAGEALQTGRETDWKEDHGLVRGLGLKTLLIGDDCLSLNDFTTLMTDGRAQS